MTERYSSFGNSLPQQSTPQYRYIRLSGSFRRERYICLDQNLFMLFFCLMSKRHPLGLGARTRTKILPTFKECFVLIVRISYFRVFSVSLTEVVQLPIFGQLCLKVHNGYKIFNLSDNTVTKVFKHSVLNNAA